MHKALGPLLGSSVLITDVDEFKLKQSLRVNILETAVDTINKELDLANTISRAKTQAALETIRTLISFNN